MALFRPQLLPNVSSNQAAYSVSIVTVNTEGTIYTVASQPCVTVQHPPVQIGGSRRPVTITPISANTTILTVTRSAHVTI